MTAYHFAYRAILASLILALSPTEPLVADRGSCHLLEPSGSTVSMADPCQDKQLHPSLLQGRKKRRGGKWRICYLPPIESPSDVADERSAVERGCCKKATEDLCPVCPGLDLCPKATDCPPVCLDLFFASATYPAVSPLPLSHLGTLVPFGDPEFVAKGSSICRVGESSFLLRERGIYWIKVTIYPSLAPLPGQSFGFALRTRTWNGEAIYLGPRIPQNNGAPISISQFYKLDRPSPQVLEVVGFSPVGLSSGNFSFVAGRGASISIVKLSALPYSH